MFALLVALAFVLGVVARLAEREQKTTHQSGSATAPLAIQTCPSFWRTMLPEEETRPGHGG